MKLDLNLFRRLMREGKLFLCREIRCKYNIAYYECDKKGDLRLVSLMNLLQNTAQRHAAKQGWGIAAMAEHSCIWLASKYAIKINRYPRANENIRILSWVSKAEKLSAIREFVVEDAKGSRLIEVVSKWALFNNVEKKFADIPEEVPVTKRTLFVTSFAQSKCKREDYGRKFSVCYDNIDCNQHVNNSIYLFWASESVDKVFRKCHSPKKIMISFRKEVVYGDEISVKTQIDGSSTIHHISSADGRENARVTIEWVSNDALTQV